MTVTRESQSLQGIEATNLANRVANAANVFPNQPTEYRAITLWQPWASLIALDIKEYETRSWETKYRGKLLIHAAARIEKRAEKLAILDQLKGTEFYIPMFRQLLEKNDFPYSCIVAIADLTDCLLMTDCSLDSSEALRKHSKKHCIWIKSPSPLERAVGLWQPSRYAWKLENVRPITPIPCQGRQGLWIPSAEIVQQVGGAK